jgi:hypothetical protein
MVEASLMVNKAIFTTSLFSYVFSYHFPQPLSETS